LRDDKGDAEQLPDPHTRPKLHLKDIELPGAK
jgi:hypothetical protein